MMDLIALEGCVLDQRDRAGQDAAFVIVVCKLGDGQYARIRANELILAALHEEMTRERGGYSTVCIKPNPTLQTPDVLLTMEDTMPWWSGTHLGLHEVFPPLKWSWDSFYFRTASIFLGTLVLRDRGVFRIYYQIADTKEEQIVDILFLL
jgi:hypothetical protein